MNDKIFQDVQRFHKSCDLYQGEPGTTPPLQQIITRHRLIEEEFDELCEAMAAGDVVEVADAVADLIYVAAGAAVDFGITDKMGAIWEEVHQTNMQKASAPKANGKVQKPADWKPPRIRDILEGSNGKSQV